MPGPRSASPIIIDESPSVVVIRCNTHPYWSALRWTLDDALDAAVAHERAHHGTRAMEQRRTQHRRRARRHAEKHAPAAPISVCPQDGK